MAVKKRKYYVVWVGRTPGIYDDWPACKAQIDGFPDARYKGFTTIKQAEEAWAAGYRAPLASQQTKHSFPTSAGGYIQKSLAVDAACSGNPGKMEYRGVDVASRKQVFHQGPFPLGTNNIGEFLGIVHGLAYLQKLQDSRPIYTDSGTAMAWVRNKKANTKLERTPATAELWHLIHRAEHWLKTNSYTTPIIKWDTKKWGEIPADFGRK